MAAPAATTTVHRLKLVFDPKIRQVLYAEASGEAMEFLYSLLDSPHVSLPFDAATRNASIGNVYDSVEKLRAAAAAANIFRPPCNAVQRQQQEEEERFFVCGGDGNGRGGARCGDYVTDKSGARCPSCGGEMAVELPRGCPGASCSDDAYGAAAAHAPGCVMGSAALTLTCMVMDDLTVRPAGAALTLASTFMMSFVIPGALQETVVSMGYTEAMEILETSLQSSTVLTDVFLRKKARRFGKAPH